MIIANLCYELYKVNWEDRISTEQKMTARGWSRICERF